VRNETEFFEMLRYGLEVYFQGGRRRGNTERMLDGVRPGDAVVVPNSAVRDGIIRILRQRNILPQQRISVRIVDPTIEALMQDATRYVPARRLHFDHTWLQAYVAREAMGAGERLERLLKEIEHPDVI
jgi:hypothetical protein